MRFCDDPVLASGLRFVSSGSDRGLKCPGIKQLPGSAVQETYTSWEDVLMPKKTNKSHRELIDTGTDKRFVRRNEKGQFEDVADVGRSLSRDRQQQAKTKVPPGQGDRGDQKRKS
jgi:hypothetical protein